MGCNRATFLLALGGGDTSMTVKRRTAKGPGGWQVRTPFTHIGWPRVPGVVSPEEGIQGEASHIFEMDGNGTRRSQWQQFDIITYKAEKGPPPTHDPGGTVRAPTRSG
jgi:hypothetical protein